MAALPGADTGPGTALGVSPAALTWGSMNSTQCAICGLPEAGHSMVPTCALCTPVPFGLGPQHPFGNPACTQSHREWFGPPEELGAVMFIANDGHRYGERYRGIVLAAALVFYEARFKAEGEDVQRWRAAPSGAELSLPIVIEQVDMWPWRELVLFPNTPVWVEVRWTPGMGHVPHIHNPRPTHWKDDTALAKKGLDLLKVTRGRGNPNLQRPDEATVAEQDNHARKALKLQKDYPRLGLASIARTHINVPHGTLKGWIANYLRRHPEAG